MSFYFFSVFRNLTMLCLFSFFFCFVFSLVIFYIPYYFFSYCRGYFRKIRILRLNISQTRGFSGTTDYRLIFSRIQRIFSFLIVQLLVLDRMAYIEERMCLVYCILVLIRYRLEYWAFARCGKTFGEAVTELTPHFSPTLRLLEFILCS